MNCLSDSRLSKGKISQDSRLGSLLEGDCDVGLVEGPANEAAVWLEEGEYVEDRFRFPDEVPTSTDKGGVGDSGS